MIRFKSQSSNFEKISMYVLAFWSETLIECYAIIDIKKSFKLIEQLSFFLYSHLMYAERTLYIRRIIKVASHLFAKIIMINICRKGNGEKNNFPLISCKVRNITGQFWG